MTNGLGMRKQEPYQRPMGRKSRLISLTPGPALYYGVILCDLLIQKVHTGSSGSGPSIAGGFCLHSAAYILPVSTLAIIGLIPDFEKAVASFKLFNHQNQLVDSHRD